MEFKQTISMKDTIQYVYDITHTVLAIDENTGELDYRPELFEIVYRKGFFDYYTDHEFEKNENGDYDLEAIQSFVYSFDDFEKECESNVNQDQLIDIKFAAKEKIKYLCETNIEYVHREADAILKQFEELFEKCETMFDGLSNEDLTKFVSAVQNGNLTGEEIVKVFTKTDKEGD